MPSVAKTGTQSAHFHILVQDVNTEILFVCRNIRRRSDQFWSVCFFLNTDWQMNKITSLQWTFTFFIYTFCFIFMVFMLKNINKWINKCRWFIVHFTEHIRSVLINGFESLPGLPGVKGLIAAYIWHNPSLSNLHPHRICNFCTLSSWSDSNVDDQWSQLKDS